MKTINPIKILNAIAFKASVAFTAAVTGIITSNAHGLQQNEVIKVATDDTLPAGLSASLYYYVVNVTTNTFQLALEKDGTPVSITSTGTGTHSFTVQAQDACFVDGFDHIELELFSSNALNNYTVKIVGSDQEDKPNFNEAVSETNRWNYIQSVELPDGNIVDGATGFTVSGALNKIVELNVNKLRWLGLLVTYTAGDLTAFVNLADTCK